jgi:hypothetical protein
MLAGRAAAGTAAGTLSAAAGSSAVSGEPRSGAGAALADDTGAGSDGVADGVVVVGTDSVAVGSDCQDTVAGSPLGQTVSPPVFVFVVTTVRCSGVGCGIACGAASGSALGGAESDGGGGGSVSVGGASSTTGGGGVVTTAGGGVGAGAGSATSCCCCPPLTIVVLSPVVGGGCCSVEEGCSFAQASLELRTKAKRHKTSATTRARGLRSCRWAWMAVFLCGRPRVKSLRTLPNVVPR